MANNIREPYVPALIASPPVLQNKDGNIGAQGMLLLLGVVRGVVAKLNGLLTFGRCGDGDWLGNIDGQAVQVVTPTPAGTEFVVYHRLGRVPRGRIVLGQNGAGSLYDSNLGGWSEAKCYFKCDATNVTFVLALV